MRKQLVKLKMWSWHPYFYKPLEEQKNKFEFASEIPTINNNLIENVLEGLSKGF